MIIIPKPLSFEWDNGNQDKSWQKHQVSIVEAEEAFFDQNKKLYPDPIHSGKESRKILIGKTQKNRVLFIVFTIRKEKVRIISARDLNKREKGLYEKTT
jgi:hypothetical protein